MSKINKTIVKKSRITQRIIPSIWLSECNFVDLLEILDENRAGVDDVMLFLNYTHSPCSLKMVCDRVELLKKRLRTLREHGFGAGIDLLCTVGFFPENLHDMPKGIPHFVCPSGEENPGSFCHNSPIYQTQYQEPVLRVLAMAGPDFLWFDDDQHGHCCCPGCMKEFSGFTGRTYTRETLIEAFNTARTSRERVAVRRQFLAFSSHSLTRHYTRMEQIVHAVDPSIQLGGMDVMGEGWNDLDFNAWMNALSGPGKKHVRWRPGGGAYNDREPDEIISRKGMLYGFESAWMPSFFTDRQSEIENFTCQRLKKSRLATAVEACIGNAVGLTGTVWNVLDGSDDLNIYRPLMRTLTQVRPFLDAQVVANNGEVPLGIWNGWTPAISSVAEGPRNWGMLSMPENPHSGELFVSGLPPAFHPDGAEVTILNGDTVRSLDDARLERILAGGLYCDVPALQNLTQRGFSDLLGFRAVENFQVDMRERLTGHPLNGAYAGCFRDGRQAFTHETAWSLEPLDGKGKSLAELIDYCNEVVSPSTMGVYRNRLGGRVVVAGYYPFRELQFQWKTGQIKAIFNFLSGKTGLTGWIASYHRIALWVRPNTITLVNASLDTGEAVELAWRVRTDAVSVIDMFGMEKSTVKGKRADDNSMRFMLPPLSPRQAYLIRTE